MKNLHIITLGTSILSNLRRKGVDLGVGSWSPWEDHTLEPLRPSPVIKKILEHLEEDPYGLSAELHAMKPYLEEGRVDTVYMISTDTNAGEICHRVLEGFFRRRNIEVKSKPKAIANYFRIEKEKGGEAAAASFAESIRLLAHHLASKIREFKDQGYEIFINATGGFKPEIGITMFLGSLYEIPVYYRFELFETTVVIPPLLPKGKTAHLEALRSLAEHGRDILMDEVRAPERVLRELEEWGLVRIIAKEGKLPRVKITGSGKAWLMFWEELRE